VLQDAYCVVIGDDDLQNLHVLSQGMAHIHLHSLRAETSKRTPSGVLAMR
jgi:hypothetical protein